MTFDAAAVDRTAAAPTPPSPSARPLRPPPEPVAAPPSPPRPGTPRGPGVAPEADRLRAQLHDPALRVTSFRDDDSGHFVLRITDRASGEVIDQYPPERLLRLFAAMRETIAGGGPDRSGLIDERA
jgi:hypothetical protein